MGAISGFASTLADDFNEMHDCLSLMSSDLRSAQKNAEGPDNSNSNMIEDAAIGTAILGPAGGVLGGLWGHHQDDVAKQQAHDRMVNLIAALAGQYELRQQRFPAPPMDPDGLPGSGTGGHATPASGPGGTSLSGGTGALGRPQSNPTRQVTPTGTSAVSPFGQPQPAATTSGTSLAGAGAAVLGTSGLSALALSALGPAGLGPLVGTTGADGVPGGGARNGVIGADDELTGRGGTGAAGARGGQSGSGTAEEDEMAARGNRAAMGTGSGNRSALTGRTGEGHEDEADERLTWLTEDEMVWGGDAATPPPVLGVDPPANPEA